MSGCAYVPEVMVKEAEEVVSMWGAGEVLCVRDEEAGGWDWEARRKIVTEVAKRKSNVHGVGQ